MKKIYDVAIIGGGPAGYTAALYAARAGFSTAVIEKMSVGGQMALTDMIDNYPGFDEGIDGFTLGMRMQNGAERFGAETVYAEVRAAELSGDIKALRTDSGELAARAVIIATGAYPRKLGARGEDERLGRGVHYCAHCDGRFYRGKRVVVVGGGNSAVKDAAYLSRIAESVILVHRRDTFRAERVYERELRERENVGFELNSVVERIVYDDKGVTGVEVENKLMGEKRIIPCDGVFVSIGRKPATEIFSSDVALDDSGYIIADETCRTSLPGVFAVGDVRTKPMRQVATAVADGACAVHFLEEYLIASGGDKTAPVSD